MGRNTIDNNNLEHGLGVGGGRGRPKGSRNGYINPNAAYMKNYEIQGEVADPLNTGLQPQNQQRQRTWAPAPQSNGPTRRMTNQEINARKAASSNNAARTAAVSVQNGKNFLERALGTASDTAKSANEWLNGNLDTNAKAEPARYHGVPNDQYMPERDEGAIARAESAVNEGLNAAGKAASNAAKSVTDAIQNTANKASQAANEWWNGNLDTNAKAEAARYHGVPNDQYMPERDEGAKARLENAAEEARVNLEKSLVDAGDTAKEWWNGLLDWGKNAWNDISGVATRAIDTGKGWAKSGLDWVNKNILDPVGSWGSRAVSDVGNWFGDRSRDLDRWWNGYDETVRNPSSGETRMQGDLKGNARQTQHVNGVRENVGTWLDQAGRDVAAIPGRVSNAVDQAGQWIGDRAEDVNRWWNGYEAAPTGSPEDRARRQAGETDHVNGARENIVNWANQTGQNIAAIPGRIGEAVDTMWNGNQVIRGNENGVTSVEGTPGLADRLFNGYVQERRVDTPANEDRRHGVANDQYAQDRVFERVAPLTEQIGNGLNQVGRDIAAIPGNVGNLVQRNIVDPVTGAVKTYLVDPVTNTAVAVADAVQNNVINPVRGAVQQFDQNVVQPVVGAVRTAADWTNENVVQPVGNFIGDQARNAGNAIGTEFRYNQNSGDNQSIEARNAGVSTRIVDELNRIAANGGDSAQAQRDQMFDVMNAATRNGVSPQVIDYLYDAMKSGAIDQSTFMNNLSGLIYATPEVVNRQNAYYTSDPYGARRNNK